MFKGIEGPLLAIILDGVGEANRELGNAVALARAPYWNYLRQHRPFIRLKAHGTAVGLPSDKDMGNSEVGHNALGAGQVYDQGAKLVGDAITSKSIFRGANWRKAVDRVLKNQGTLHFIGLLSDGNVHSHINHLLALLDQTAKEGVVRSRVHALLDGRDVSGVSAHGYVAQLETKLDQLNSEGRDYRIAGGGGRMTITMDRYGANWSMVEAGWRHHVQGRGRTFPDTQTAIETLRAENPGILDQDLPGFVIAGEQGPNGPILDGDSVIFFNFRGDRAIEISQAFDGGDDFDKFPRGHQPDVFYAGMMQYDGDLACPKNFLVGPPNIRHTLSEFLIEARLSQFAISETQKFGHVTYFWNGNRSGKTAPSLEESLEIPSDIVPFQQRPWMKAAEITDALILALQSGRHRFLRVNYPNGDMVGHTGDLEAAILAMECIDLQLRRLLKAVAQVNGVALITADHGNCDEMFELDGNGKPSFDASGTARPKTSHTLNPVPFILYDPHHQVPATLRREQVFSIAHVAATVVELLGLPAPSLWHPSLLRWDQP